MGLLDKEIRNLRSGFTPEPDVLDLVPLFNDHDRILYEQRLQALQHIGLADKLAEHTAAEDVLCGRPITKAAYIESWYWMTRVFPTGLSEQARTWIQNHTIHGPAINEAEAQVNRIGSRGDPMALQKACDAWVEAWREAIEEWRKGFAQ